MVGDLLAAVKAADALNDRLTVSGRSGMACKAITIPELIERFINAQEKRVDAREIKPGTARRYRTALRKTIEYVEKTPAHSKLRAGAVDATFIRDLKNYLFTLQLHPNGHPHSDLRPITEAGVRFILSAAYSAWGWAALPDVRLLPEGLTNPFAGAAPPRPEYELLSDARFPSSGIIRIVERCDEYQLAILAPIMLYGLRPGEPRHVMVEDWNREEGTLRVNCDRNLEYETKGATNKRFPVPPVLATLLERIVGSRSGGPLFIRRALFEQRQTGVRVGSTRQVLTAEYFRRVAGVMSVAERVDIRERLMSEAGAVSYDQIDAEFRKLTAGAGLGSEWTLKSLRHHFADQLESSNVSYYARKYLMGHRFKTKTKRDTLNTYTRINFGDLKTQYNAMLEGCFAPIVQAIENRVHALGLGQRSDAA